MNTLNSSAYPKTEQPGFAARSHRPPALMITRRRINPGCREDFDEALAALVAFAGPFPGHIDVHVLCRACGRSCEFAIAHRFADSAARANFTSSPEYFQWLGQIRVLTHSAWERSGPERGAGSDGPSAQSSESPSRLYSMTGAGLVFVAMPAAMGLPFAVFMLPSGLHSIGRVVVAAILLFVFLAWSLSQGFPGRRDALRLEPRRRRIG